jgi:uncharacterized glyoxalase superfamily protein PhnB
MAIEAVAYLRTSAAANAGQNRYSEHRQRDAIERFARHAGFIIVETFGDAAVSGADPIESRRGFAALLNWIDSHGLRTVIVEDATTFARDLVTQERSVRTLVGRGVRVLTSSGDDLTETTEASTMAMRRTVGASASLEDARLPAMLRHVPDSKSAEIAAKRELRPPLADLHPNAALQPERLGGESQKPGERATRESRLIPFMRYRNVDGAITWLCNAFGFEQRNIVKEDDGTIRHAQLIYGTDMIILLPASPSDTNGHRETQSLYFVVDDAEKHCRVARAAGADVLENGEYAFGGRGYSCRDPEGYIWHFGTLNPRQQNIVADLEERARSFACALRDKFNSSALVAAVLAAIVGFVSVGGMFVVLQASASGKKSGMASATMLPVRADDSPVRMFARLAHAQLPSTGLPPPATTRHDEASERSSQQTGEPASRKIFAFRSVEASQRAHEGADGRAWNGLAADDALSRPREMPRSGVTEAREPAAAAASDHREQQPLGQRAMQEAPTDNAAAKEVGAKEADKAVAEAGSEKKRRGQPQKAPDRPSQEPKVGADPDGGWAWECGPSLPSGQIACYPVVKKRTSTKAPGAKQKPFATETVAESASKQKVLPAQKPRRTAEQSANLWDCQPMPPDGQVACRPIPGSENLTRQGPNK